MGSEGFCESDPPRSLPPTHTARIIQHEDNATIPLRQRTTQINHEANETIHHTLTYERYARDATYTCAWGATHRRPAH